MRKLLAAFLVAALSLLSFTAPAQANEAPIFIPAEQYPPPYALHGKQTEWGSSTPSHPVVGGYLNVQLGGRKIWGDRGSALKPEVKVIWYMETNEGDVPVELEESVYYYNQWEIDESLLGKRLRAVYTAHLDGYEFEPVEMLTLEKERWFPEVRYYVPEPHPTGTITVSGKTANNPSFLLVGNTLAFSLDEEIEPESSFECYWYGDTWAIGGLQNLGSCDDELILEPKHVNHRVYAAWKIAHPDRMDVYGVANPEKEVRFPADAIKLEYKLPMELRANKSATVEIQATSLIGVPLEYPSYFSKIESPGHRTDRYGSKFDLNLELNSGIGQEKILNVHLRTDNYDVVLDQKSLGVLQPAKLDNLTNPVIELRDRYVRVAEVPWIYDEGLKISYEWLVDGKVSTKSRDEHIFKVLPEHFGREIQLRIRVAADGYEEAELTSQKIVYPKESIPYFGIPAISGDMTVGTTVTATRMWTDVPGLSFTISGLLVITRGENVLRLKVEPPPLLKSLRN